jgi:hypothetical protein
MALDILCHLELLITTTSIKKRTQINLDYRTTKQQGRRPIQDDLSSTNTLHTGIYIRFKEAIT